MNLEQALALVGQDEVPWERIPEELDVPMPDWLVHLARLRWEKGGGRSDDPDDRMALPDYKNVTPAEKNQIAARMAQFRVRRANAKTNTGSKLTGETFALPEAAPPSYGKSLAEKLRATFR